MRHERMVKLMILAVFILTMLPVGVQAGLIIREQEYTSDDPELKSITVSELQKNRIRFQEEEDIIFYVWDLEGNRLTQVNTDSKIYASGTFDEEIGNLKKYLATVQQQFLEELKQTGETPPPRQATSPREAVKITRTEETAVIAGYKAVKFEIRRGDKLVEELWLSKELNVTAEIEYPRFKKMYQSWMNAITEAMAEMGEDSSPAWLRSDEYLKLFDEGYAVKQVEYLEEGAYISEVVSVQKKDVPVADFQAPEGFRKVSAQEFMEGGDE